MTDASAPFRAEQHADLALGSEPAIAQRVREEQLSLIFTRANRGGNYAGLLLALGLWLTSFFALGNAWALAWGVAMHGTQLLRWHWVRRYAGDPAAAAADPKWVRGYVTHLGINGTIWGAAPLVMFDDNNLRWVTVCTVAVIAVFNGGQRWVAPVRAAVLAYSIPFMLGLCLAFALEGSTMFRVMAAFALLYLPVSLRIALQQTELLERSIRDRLANQRLAEALAEKNRLIEHTSAQKSRFFAAASHDLRQPMHAIALFSGSLEHELRGTPLHDNALRSLSAVRSLSESLDAMLDVSKLDAGVVVANPRPVCVQHIFQRLNPVLQPQALEKGLHLRFRATALKVNTDELLLERMLSNLAWNAVKYTDAGGVLIGTRRHHGQAVIEVWDTGVGIPADQQDKIFEEFYQLGNPGRDRSLGLGIGLAVVRRLSGLLGLPLVLRSRPGRGSVFRVYIPAASVLPDATQAELSSVAPVAPEPVLPGRVLVLDDEDDILAAVRSVLRGYGVEVLTASTCDEALAVLKGPVAVGALLCDLRLGGGVSGLQFARGLVKEHGIHVPTIMVTGETSPEALREIRASGFLAVFKPVSADALVAALSEVRGDAGRQTPGFPG